MVLISLYVFNTSYVNFYGPTIQINCLVTVPINEWQHGRRTDQHAVGRPSAALSRLQPTRSRKGHPKVLRLPGRIHKTPPERRPGQKSPPHPRQNQRHPQQCLVRAVARTRTRILPVQQTENLRRSRFINGKLHEKRRGAAIFERETAGTVLNNGKQGPRGQ